MLTPLSLQPSSSEFRTEMENKLTRCIRRRWIRKRFLALFLQALHHFCRIQQTPLSLCMKSWYKHCCQQSALCLPYWALSIHRKFNSSLRWSGRRWLWAKRLGEIWDANKLILMLFWRFDVSSQNCSLSVAFRQPGSRWLGFISGSCKSLPTAEIRYHCFDDHNLPGWNKEARIVTVCGSGCDLGATSCIIWWEKRWRNHLWVNSPRNADRN